MTTRESPRNIAGEVAGARRRRLGPIGLLIRLATAPFYSIKAHKSRDEYAKRQHDKQQHDQKDVRNRTPPKVSKRKRALSLSQEPDNSERTKLQLQSRLCMLPAELRLRVYEHIVGVEDGIHVAFLNGNLLSYRCQWSHDLILPMRHMQCWNHYCNEDWTTNISTAERGSSRLGVLHLLRTCRLIYTECIVHLYSQPTFLLHEFPSFAAFFGSILPQRFNTIRRVSLHQLAAPCSRVLPKHFNLDLFGKFASYEVFQQHPNFIIRNPILHPISPGEDAENYPDINTWVQVLGILRQMTGLREMLVACYADRLGPKDEVAHRVLGIKGGDVAMQEALEQAWQDKGVGDWNDFEATTFVFGSGGKWHGVKWLRWKGCVDCVLGKSVVEGARGD